MSPLCSLDSGLRSYIPIPGFSEPQFSLLQRGYSVAGVLRVTGASKPQEEGMRISKPGAGLLQRATMVSEDGHQEASPLYPSPPVEVVRIPGSEAF